MTNDDVYVIDFGEVRSEVRRKYEPWAVLFSEIERFCRRIQHDVSINRANSQEFLVALLYARTISNTNAAVVVLEAGFDVQCRILLRAAMDSMFSLVAIARKPAQADRFIAADARERKRILHKARTWSDPALKAEAAKHATDEKLKEIEDEIKAVASARISAEEMARVAGLQDWYTTAYSMLSASVHSNVRDLERHLVIANDGDIESIRNEPVLIQLDRLYLTACELLLQAAGALESVFDTQTESFRREKFEVLSELRTTIEV